MDNHETTQTLDATQMEVIENNFDDTFDAFAANVRELAKKHQKLRKDFDLFETGMKNVHTELSKVITAIYKELARQDDEIARLEGEIEDEVKTPLGGMAQMLFETCTTACATQDALIEHGVIPKEDMERIEASHRKTLRDLATAITKVGEDKASEESN